MQHAIHGGVRVLASRRSREEGSGKIRKRWLASRQIRLDIYSSRRAKQNLSTQKKNSHRHSKLTMRQTGQKNK